MKYVYLEGISKSYGDTSVLQELSLEVNEGEFFFLLGPSGCGKTTLLKILSGLLQPDTGRIYLQNNDITRVPAHKRDINTVFQNYALFPHMNVFDNVAFGLKLKKLSSDVIRGKVEDALKLVNLEGFSGRMPSQMSGGQMQRVSLARAIVNEPALLLLDEPLGALDVKLRKQMQGELRRIQEKLGTTFICVTHDQEEALTLGDRIAVMNHGIIEQIGNSDQLYNHPGSFFVCDFLGDCNFFSHLEAQKEGDLFAIKFEETTLFAKDPNFDLSSNRVRIGIRLEKINIGKATDNANSLKIRIEKLVFTGTHFTVYGSTAGDRPLRLTIPNNERFKTPEIGAEIDVSWSYDNTIMLEDAS